LVPALAAKTVVAYVEPSSFWMTHFRGVWPFACLNSLKLLFQRRPAQYIELLHWLAVFVVEFRLVSSVVIVEISIKVEYLWFLYQILQRVLLGHFEVLVFVFEPWSEVTGLAFDTA
jgi:hypothetical protein